LRRQLKRYLEKKEEGDKKIDSDVVKNIFSQMLKSLDKEQIRQYNLIDFFIL